MEARTRHIFSRDAKLKHMNVVILDGNKPCYVYTKHNVPHSLWYGIWEIFGCFVYITCMYITEENRHALENEPKEVG